VVLGERPGRGQTAEKSQWLSFEGIPCTSKKGSGDLDLARGACISSRKRQQRVAQKSTLGQGSRLALQRRATCGEANEASSRQ
jgi:hypothetical protein